MQPQKLTMTFLIEEKLFHFATVKHILRLSKTFESQYNLHFCILH